LIEAVLEEEVDGVGAAVGEAAEAAEEAEQEEPDALFVETSSKDTAVLVQHAPFPTIYRTRMNTKLQANPLVGGVTHQADTSARSSWMNQRGLCQSNNNLLSLYVCNICFH
jgi:hypothetical protein